MGVVLIVDDDEIFGKSLAALAHDEGFEVHLAGNLRTARALAARCRVDLLALDLDLPDGNGLDLIDDLDLSTHGRVVVITGTPSVETAAQAVALPVLEYLVKPVQMHHWASLLHQLRATDTDQPAGQSALVGESPPIRSVASQLRELAPLDINVLVTGATGTGKELAARILHDASGRRGDFIPLNCGAIPRDLLAAELFGVAADGFAGSVAAHAGVFERASGGTLFLDEIAELAPELQVFLLRALETGEITRVGGSEPVIASARVVAATNRDPAEAIADGSLRADLYYRLADAVVRMPDLRECGDDVLLLAETFVARLNARHGRNKRLARGSFATLKQHAWPGNVRELRSAVQRAWLLGSGEIVHVRPANRTAPLYDVGENVVFRVGMTFAEVERRILVKTLESCGNDKTAAAKLLGVSVRTIHNQLAKLGVQQVAGNGGAPG